MDHFSTSRSPLAVDVELHPARLAAGRVPARGRLGPAPSAASGDLRQELHQEPWGEPLAASFGEDTSEPVWSSRALPWRDGRDRHSGEFHRPTSPQGVLDVEHRGRPGFSADFDASLRRLPPPTASSSSAATFREELRHFELERWQEEARVARAVAAAPHSALVARQSSDTSESAAVAAASEDGPDAAQARAVACAARAVDARRTESVASSADAAAAAAVGAAGAAVEATLRDLRRSAAESEARAAKAEAELERAREQSASAELQVTALCERLMESREALLGLVEAEFDGVVDAHDDVLLSGRSCSGAAADLPDLVASLSASMQRRREEHLDAQRDAAARAAAQARTAQRLVQAGVKLWRLQQSQRTASTCSQMASCSGPPGTARRPPLYSLPSAGKAGNDAAAAGLLTEMSRALRELEETTALGTAATVSMSQAERSPAEVIDRAISAKEQEAAPLHMRALTASGGACASALRSGY